MAEYFNWDLGDDQTVWDFIIIIIILIVITIIIIIIIID